MLLRNLLQYLSTYLTNWAAMHAVADIRTRLFAHLQNLSLGFFNRASTGDLIARATNDTQILYGIIGASVASAVKDPVTIVCLIVYQLATNTRHGSRFDSGDRPSRRVSQERWRLPKALRAPIRVVNR